MLSASATISNAKAEIMIEKAKRKNFLETNIPLTKIYECRKIRQKLNVKNFFASLMQI